MKKGLLVVLWLFACGMLFGGDHAFFSLGVNYLEPSDSAYRDVYGQRVFYPEAQAGLRLMRSFYLTGGFGWLSKNGETVTLHLPTKSTQNYISAGLAYIGTITGGLKIKLGAGAVDVTYKEEAMGERLSGSKIGWQGEFGLLLMRKSLFAGINFGYMSASDWITVETVTEPVKIKLGGARAGLCLGFRI
jgi:hypothetical protein